jgi:hypothetical protein
MIQEGNLSSQWISVPHKENVTHCPVSEFLSGPKKASNKNAYRPNSEHVQEKDPKTTIKTKEAIASKTMNPKICILSMYLQVFFVSTSSHLSSIKGNFATPWIK